MSFFDQIGLTDAQQEARKGKLTASRVGVLMNGNEQAQHDLWLEMTGQKEPEDLSRVFPVVLGSWTEALNLAWIEREHGITIARRGEVVVDGWASCTLDGVAGDIVIEAKHVNGFSKMDEVEARYWPQVHWQMWLTGLETAWLSVIIGTNAPQIAAVEFNQPYFEELHFRASMFMDSVQSGTPPTLMEPKAAPIAGKIVDMTGNNEWADAAARWVNQKDSANDFKKADKTLKDATPDDAVKAHGHGVEVNRAKNGSLRVKETK